MMQRFWSRHSASSKGSNLD